MSLQKYESGKLSYVLESLFKENASGVLSLKSQVSSWHNQRSCVLMLRNGALVYGELNISKIPNNQEICQLLGEKLRPNMINAALAVAKNRITNPTSVREFIELLITMRVFTWQEVEAFMITKIVVILEQFLSNPGQVNWQPNVDFDLSYGENKHCLNWLDIKQEINQRQQKWEQYAPIIPSMDGIPFVTSEQLQKIGDRNVKKHLASSANGKNTLLDIADKMGKDPLKVAKSYVNWVNNGWVSFDKISELNQKNLATVLSVDDSAIIQVSIRRALQEHYNVLLANNASDALKILNEKSVELMLLDLTMPDVDGLEFCQKIRAIPKFRDLPIIMVTARDGLVNKMKGHIAGTNKYLTKPFEPEQLRKIVGHYIKN